MRIQQLYRLSLTEFVLYDQWFAGNVSYRVVVFRKRKRAILICGEWSENTNINYILNLNPNISPRLHTDTISRKALKTELPWETVE